jgi:glycine betaine/proline transport system substrate-binding protein
MWWQPTWLATIYKLKPVDIDEEGCAKGKAAGITSGEVFDCAGKPVEIVKYAWPGLKDKWPAAYRFLKAYQMTNEWQAPMAMAVEVESQKPADVAKKWVDENEAIWKPWVDAAM